MYKTLLHFDFFLLLKTKILLGKAVVYVAVVHKTSYHEQHKQLQMHESNSFRIQSISDRFAVCRQTHIKEISEITQLHYLLFHLAHTLMCVGSLMQHKESIKMHTHLWCSFITFDITYNEML